MAEPDGSIIIDTTLDEKGFTAGSERLNAAVKLLRKKVDELGPTLQNAVNGSLGDLTALKEQFAAVSAEAAGVEKEIRDFGETKVETEQYRRVCENLERAEQDLEKLRDKQELMDDVGIDISPQIDRAINDVKRLQAMRDELKKSGGAYEDVSAQWDYDHLQRGIQAAKDALAAQLEQLKGISVTANTEPARESVEQLQNEAEKPIRVPIVPDTETPEIPEVEAVKTPIVPEIEEPPEAVEVPIEPVAEKQAQIETPEEIQVPVTPVVGEAAQIESPEPIEAPVTPTVEEQAQIEAPEPVKVPVKPVTEGQAQIETPEPIEVPVKPILGNVPEIETPEDVKIPVKPVIGDIPEIEPQGEIEILVKPVIENVPKIETPETIEILVKPVVEDIPVVEAPEDIEIQVKPVIEDIPEIETQDDIVIPVKPVVENIPKLDVQEDVTVPVEPEIDRQAASTISGELTAAMQEAERAVQELNAELDAPDGKIRNAGKASVYLKESLKSAGAAASIFVKSFATNAPVESLDDARAAMSDCAASAKKYGAAVRDFLNHPRGKQQTASELEQRVKDLNDAAEQLRQAAGESMGKSFESSGVNVTTLQNKITSLLNQTERLGPAFQKAMSGGEQEMTAFESKARILNRTFEDTIQRVNKFGQTEFQTDEYKQLDHDLQAAAKHYETLLTEKERYEHTGTKENSKEWRNLIFRLEQAEHQYQQLSGAAERMKQSGNATFRGTDTAEYQQMAQALADVTAKFAQMNSMAARADSGASRIGTALKNVGKKALQAAVAIAKVVGQAALTGLKKLGSLAGGAAKSLLGLDKSARKSSGSFKTGFSTILKYGLGIRSLYILVNKLRSALVEGYENLAQYSVETNAAISSVKSALTQLKNSFATAFAPILTVVAPILAQLINMLSTAITYLGMFFAALTGQTSFTKAIAVQEDYADSLNATGSAAEAAQKQLAGFDELNVLSDSSGSGGSGSGTDIADMFETVEIEPYDFESWGAAFSAALDKIINDGIPKLRSALSAVADEINEFSANLYEALTFPGVYDKVCQIGADLADALNDFADQIDWATIGGALGAGLNLALGFLVSFLYEFDWKGLGGHLAELVNNAVAEIDWSNLGALLWAKFKIALELFEGFILELDMPEVADAMSDLVTGFFDSMTDTISNIQWSEIGEQIKTLLTNIRWAEIGTSVAEAMNSIVQAVEDLHLGALLAGALNGAFTSLLAWAKEFDWQGLGDAIGSSIKDFFATWEPGITAETLSKLANGILKAAIAAVGQINWVEIGLKIVNFLAEINWVDLLNKVGELGFALMKAGVALAVGIIEGFISAFVDPESAFGQLLNGKFETFNQWICDTLFPDSSIENAYRKGTEFGGRGGFGTSGTGYIGGVIDGITDGADDAAKAAEIAGRDITKGLAKGITGEESGLEGTVYETLFSRIIKKIKSLWGISSPSTVMMEIGGYIAEGLLNGISNTWESITDFLSRKTEDMKSALSEAWESIKETAGEKWESISDTVSEKWEDVKKATSGAVETVKSTVSDKWETVREKTSSAWESVKTTVSDKWKSITSDTDESSDIVYTKLSGAWDSVKATTSSAWGDVSKTLTDFWNGAAKDTSSSTAAMESTIATSWSKNESTVEAKTDSMDSAVSSKFGRMESTVSDKTKTALNSVTGNFAGILSTITTKCTSVVSTVSSKFSDVSSTATRKTKELLSTLKSIDWSVVGTNICSGIKSGIAAGWSALKSYVKEKATALLDAAKDALDINSPSGKFRDEVGLNIGYGVEEGVVLSESSILKSVVGIADSIAETINDGEYGVFSLGAEESGLDAALAVFSGKVSDSFTALMEKLQAIAENVTISVPTLAMQNAIPYNVAAKVDVTDDISGTITASNEELGSVFIQAFTNMTAAIVNAIETNSGTTVNIDKRSLADAMIQEVNRRTRMTGASPLLT